MEINMPVKDPNNKPSEVTNALTLLLTDKNKVYWYWGALKPETQLTLTDFRMMVIRKLLLEERNQPAIDDIKSLIDKAAKTNMSDTTLKKWK